MKPSPLKNKRVAIENIDYFDEVHVKSAVEWLKEQVDAYESTGLLKRGKMIKALIDQAFEDVEETK